MAIDEETLAVLEQTGIDVYSVFHDADEEELKQILCQKVFDTLTAEQQYGVHQGGAGIFIRRYRAAERPWISFHSDFLASLCMRSL